MRIRTPSGDITLKELKELIQKHKERGVKIVAELKKLQGHYEQMQSFYSTWQDDMTALERIIDGANEDHGLPVEKIEEFDILADALGDIEND